LLNGQKIEELEMVPDKSWVLVSPGKVDGNKLWLEVLINDTGIYDICHNRHVYVEINPNVNFTDDAAMQAILRKVGTNYSRMCPDPIGNKSSVPITLYRKGDKTKPDFLDLPHDKTASARFNDWENDLERGSYRNSISEKLQLAQKEKERDAEFAAKQKQNQQQIEAFTRKNSIKAWVTLYQVLENPFKWEGKPIATVARLNRMLSQDSALIETRDDFGKWRYAFVKLKGITPDFPDGKHAVVIAAKVREEEKKEEDDKDDDDNKINHYLDFIDVMVCELPNCADYTQEFRTKSGDKLEWGKMLQ